MSLSKESKKTYVEAIKSGINCRCPFCDHMQSVIKKEQIEFGPTGELYVRINCPNCDTIYKEVYTISDIFEVFPINKGE